MARCEEMTLLLGPFEDGELEPHEMQEVARHLAGCPACETELAGYLMELPGIPAERVARMGLAAHEVARGYTPAECAKRVFASIQNVMNGDAAKTQHALQHV